MDLYAHIKSFEILDGGAYPKSVELLGGEYGPSVSPKIPHGIVQSNLISIFRRLAADRGLVLPEVHVRPGRVDGTKRAIVPDLAFVSWGRLNAMLPDDAEQPTSPDVAVEIRSPSYNATYLSEKIRLYLSTGTLLVLDVVPAQRAILAYDATSERRYENGEAFEHPAVDWLRFAVAEAFEFLDRLTNL